VLFITWFVLNYNIAADDAASTTKEKPLVNSVGLEFAPVPGTHILMCKTDTRIKDFRRFIKEANYVVDPGMYVQGVKEDRPGHYKMYGHFEATASWDHHGFEQSDDEPVVGVNWYDAKAFCDWLSKKENRTYRLPTHMEWSLAVGPTKYPWGNDWPPTNGAGNYGDASFGTILPKQNWPVIPGYDDGTARISPVGKYPPNPLGLYDMGGNVWQWCENKYRASMNDADALERNSYLKDTKESDGTPWRVRRGGGWYDNLEMRLRSSFRAAVRPTRRSDDNGFRCAIVIAPPMP